MGLCIDKDNNESTTGLFVADRGNHRVLYFKNGATT
eukprot:CAMPEP_0116936824 /NCGR_PEP_ID=MMETSP0467-20121206/31125_1 /TAXON_ID=283647 /ORGANISM="Mesodinium pulex, Strain SPMC105" /LENGTH=35 /DNA_ID= /DNA_START= /DNA_END= /DNA_ORIENTATION=